MDVIATALPEVLLIQPAVHRDVRGFFVEAYHAHRYRDLGIDCEFVSEATSRSVRNTVRGLHLQLPRAQARLLRVIQGEIFDVAVDVRRGSPQFGKWVGFSLSSENMRQCYIPPGFAHGYCVTSATAMVTTKFTNFHDPASEVNIAWNDPELAIPWPVTVPLLSTRDQHALPLRMELRALLAVPLVQIVDVTPELLRFLKEDSAHFRHLSPETFERVVADRLARMGYNVALAGGTYHKDGGVDLIATPRHPGAGHFLLAGQVKHHRTDQKTGRAAVDRLLSWKNGVFSLGLLVTNTTFTADATWTAAQDNNRFFARLRDIDDLKRWLEDNFASDVEFRELPAEIELAPGVKIKIPRPGRSGIRQ